jgi:hypothetical protein
LVAVLGVVLVVILAVSTYLLSLLEPLLVGHGGGEVAQLPGLQGGRQAGRRVGRLGDMIVVYLRTYLL